MKVGIRTPNLNKSLKARTTGKAKRQIKKAINPAYGKNGMGWVKDPKRAAYNKVYNKTTFSFIDNSNLIVWGIVLFVIAILALIIF